MANEQVYSLNVETGDIAKRLSEIRTELEGNTAKIQEYQKSVKAGNRLTDEQNNELLRLRDSNRTLKREQTVLTQVQNANTNSLDQQRKQLIAARIQWDKMSEAERENSKEGQQLKATINQLNTAVSGAEESTGRFQRGVGNYTNAIKEAMVGSKAFGGAFGGLNKIMAMNPILLVVTALSGLIAGISKAQFVVDAFNKVIEPMNAILQRTIGLFQTVVKMLKDGEFSFKAFGEAAKEAFTGAIAEGRRLAALTIEIADATNSLALSEGRLNREFEEQVELSKDLSITAKEREAAANRAIKLAEQLKNEQKAVLDLQIEEAQIRAAQNDTDRAAQLELNKLIAQRDELEANFTRRTRRVNSELRTLNKQQEAERIAAIKERQKAEEQTAAQLIKDEEARQKAFADLSKKELDTQLKATGEFYKDQELIRKEQLARDLVAVAGNAEAEKAVRAQAEKDIQALKVESTQVQIQILEDYADKVAGTDDMIFERQRQLANLATEEQIALYEKGVCR
jgi:hypothetical protein